MPLNVLVLFERVDFVVSERALLWSHCSTFLMSERCSAASSLARLSVVNGCQSVPSLKDDDELWSS